MIAIVTHAPGMTIFQPVCANCGSDLGGVGGTLSEAVSNAKKNGWVTAECPVTANALTAIERELAAWRPMFVLSNINAVPIRLVPRVTDVEPARRQILCSHCKFTSEFAE